jgi:hypothetical protein
MPLNPSYAKLLALKKLLFPGNPKSKIRNPKSKAVEKSLTPK